MSFMGPRNHVLDGVEILSREEVILGVAGESLYAAKGIIYSSITARYAMRPFVKIL